MMLVMVPKTRNSRRARRIRIGVSSCLLGQPVRYDGGHKYAAYIARDLGRCFELVPVCPEVAIGLGVPRPPMQLVGKPQAPRARVIEEPARDYTRKLAAYGRRMARELDDLSGYVFKSRSPSCALGGVPVYPRLAGGRARHAGRGIYAHALLTAQPLLPAIEEEALVDARVRVQFVQRVRTYHRWQQLAAIGLTRARLRDFHARHRRLVASRDWFALERLLARTEGRPLKQVAKAYIQRLMQALARPAAARKKPARRSA